LQTAENTRVFYPELESLRGLAALAVSLCHVFNSAQRAGKTYAEFGFNDWGHYVLTSLFSSEGGVAIFFVLSGFVLSCGLSDEVMPRGYASFAIRRIFRIMPAAWASIIFALLVLHLAHYPSPEWDKIANAAFLWTADGIPINPPLWSLSVEMTISALLPMMVAANTRFALIFQIVLAWIFYWASNLEGVSFFIPYLFAFQLGIMIPSMSQFVDRLNDRLAAIFLIVALISVMSATNLNWQGVIWPRDQVHFEIVGAFYVVAYVHCRKSASLTTFMNRTSVRFLGRVSYSMYVLNYPLLVLFWDHGPHQPFNLWIMLKSAVVFIPLNIAAAWVSYRLFEVPFVRWGHQLSKRLLWRAPASSLRVLPYKQAAG
jgi:peptidoglycan/LPS O-acetylase OafA/YrhL